MSKCHYGLLGIAASAVLLAGTTLAGAQAPAGSTPPAAAPAKAPAAAGTMPMKMPMKTPAHHASTTHTTAKAAKKTVAGDAEVAKLNDMSYQAATAGKPFTPAAH